jgi:hypothetical protein
VAAVLVGAEAAEGFAAFCDAVFGFGDDAGETEPLSFSPPKA